MSDHTPTLAQLLEHLFEVRRHPSGRKYSLREVATATDGRVGYQAIHRLRTGLSDNPTWATIQALCLFFEVSPNYFFPHLAQINTRPVPPFVLNSEPAPAAEAERGREVAAPPSLAGDDT